VDPADQSEPPANFSPSGADRSEGPRIVVIVLVVVILSFFIGLAALAVALS
jgi:hypothetical protein